MGTTLKKITLHNNTSGLQNLNTQNRFLVEIISKLNQFTINITIKPAQQRHRINLND